MKVYVTQYHKGDALFGGQVLAESWEHAEQIAGLIGHEVTGELVCTIPAEGPYVEIPAEETRVAMLAQERRH